MVPEFSVFWQMRQLLLAGSSQPEKVLSYSSDKVVGILGAVTHGSCSENTMAILN